MLTFLETERQTLQISKYFIANSQKNSIAIFQYFQCLIAIQSLTSFYQLEINYCASIFKSFIIFDTI